MYRLKKFFLTVKQTLIKDVTKERNMEWLAENKVKLTFLCIHLTCLLCYFDSLVSNSCLKLLKIARIVLVTFFATLNYLTLSDSKIIFSSLTLPVVIGLNTFWVRKMLTYPKLYRDSLSFQAPWGCCFQKQVSILLDLTKSFSQRIWIFMCTTENFIKIYQHLIF